jgi:hypothetical protein
MSARSATPAAALLLLFSATEPLSAQVLRGTLIDQQRNPIIGATITLKDSAGAAIGAVISDDRGSFHLPARRAGFYTTDIRRIGFDPWVSPAIRLDRDESVEIEVRMNAQPPVMATMTIRGRANREWGRDGWSKRQAAGKGTFLTGADVMDKRTPTVAEALKDVAGLQLIYRPFPTVSSTTGQRCLNLLLNRQPVPLIPGQPVEQTLHSIIGPEQVAGVEIYPQYRDVPPEFRNMAVQSLRPDREAQLPPATVVAEPGRTKMCGIINVWTWRAW